MLHRLRIAGTAFCASTLLLVGGCSNDAGPKPDEHADDRRAHPATSHAEKGPHGGQLIELGRDEYHAELVHDDDAHRVTIYLLDGAARQAVGSTDREVRLNLIVAGTPQPFQLPAAAQPGDAAGLSSRYELTSEALCMALDDAKTDGRLNVVIAGKPYAGEVTQAGHHDHR